MVQMITSAVDTPPPASADMGISKVPRLASPPGTFMSGISANAEAAFVAADASSANAAALESIPGAVGSAAIIDCSSVAVSVASASISSIAHAVSKHGDKASMSVFIVYHPFFAIVDLFSILDVKQVLSL